MARKKGNSKWLGSIFLIVGLGLCLGGVWAMFHMRSFVARARQAPGVVTGLDTNHGSKGTSYSPVFEFTSEDGFKHVVHSRIFSRPAAFNVGEQVTVLYDPDVPADARIDSFSQLWLLPSILIPMGFIFMLLGAAVSGLMKWLWARIRGPQVAIGLDPPEGSTPSTPKQVDAANPFARTDAPVLDNRRDSAGGTKGAFGSGAKYE